MFGRVDAWAVAIYMVLMVIGWFSVCSACYTYGDTNLLDLHSKAGMQAMWIGAALLLALGTLLVKDSHFESLAYIIYIAFMLLLVATIFNPHEIKGSRSWLVLGPIHIQPAELAKFAVALAVAKLLSTKHDWLIASALVLLPMLCIVAQKETGSALVYLAFFLVFYREGMTGSLLFTGLAFVVYFVVGVKYSDVPLFITPTPVGEYLVLCCVMLFTIAMLWRTERQEALLIAILAVGGVALATLAAFYIVPFHLAWVLVPLIVLLAGYLVVRWVATRRTAHLLLALFALVSTAFYYSVDYTMDNVLQVHQRTRINVLLDKEEDLRGAGYNVHQSEIAIGSGGLLGKGFLNGTQTKLKYVPEKETDFIFCTIGEEFGFVGCATVLLLYLALILRLIYLAERQTAPFARIYGYAVMAIFLFHLLVNVGMVIGLAPVIGIPLPFIS